MTSLHSLSNDDDDDDETPALSLSLLSLLSLITIIKIELLRCNLRQWISCISLCIPEARRRWSHSLVQVLHDHASHDVFVISVILNQRTYQRLHDFIRPQIGCIMWISCCIDHFINCSVHNPSNEPFIIHFFLLPHLGSSRRRRVHSALTVVFSLGWAVSCCGIIRWLLWWMARDASVVCGTGSRSSRRRGCWGRFSS